MKNFASELRRGTLELILLRLLAERPTYGYELVRRLAGEDTPTIKEGTVYPVLYRLEDRGWIAPQWTAPDGGAPKRGVPRKVYELTDAGTVRLGELTEEWRAFVRWVDGHLTASSNMPDQEENDDA